MPRSLGAAWPLGTEGPPCLSHLLAPGEVTVTMLGLHKHRDSVSRSQGDSETSDSNKAPSLDLPLSCVSPPCCCLSSEATPTPNLPHLLSPPQTLSPSLCPSLTSHPRSRMGKSLAMNQEHLLGI